MIDGLSYQDALQAVHDGRHVAIAVGRTEHGPAIAWITLQLDAESRAIAHHPSDTVRAAQAVGCVRHLSRAAERAGFVSA